MFHRQQSALGSSYVSSIELDVDGDGKIDEPIGVEYANGGNAGLIGATDLMLRARGAAAARPPQRFTSQARNDVVIVIAGLDPAIPLRRAQRSGTLVITDNEFTASLSRVPGTSPGTTATGAALLAMTVTAATRNDAVTVIAGLDPAIPLRWAQRSRTLVATQTTDSLRP